MIRSTVSRCLAAAILLVPLWVGAQDIGDLPTNNIPEPETLWLVGLAIVGTIASRRNRRK